MIPKQFNILGHVVKVTYDDNLEGMGEAYNSLNYIKLSKFLKGDELPLSVIEHTYFHELVHVILDSMGEDRLSSSEKFVDTFSGLLHQALKTSKY